MVPGDGQRRTVSPIVQAIREAQRETTGEIRVQISRRWLEKDPFARARKLFSQFGMTRTSHRNAVLLYVNTRTRRFALVGDQGIHEAVGQRYWDELAQALGRDLQSTQIERAIAIAVLTLGATLKRFFPA